MSNINFSSPSPLFDKREQIMQEIEQEEKIEKQYKSFLLKIDDILSLPDIETIWVVKSIVLSQGITIVSGLPNHFKSLFVQFLVKAVASGTPFLNQFETTQGTVLVIDREIPSQRLKRRWSSIGDLRGLPILFYPYTSTFKLDNPHDADLLKKLVIDHNIKLVIIDTINRSHSGKEINSSNEVAQIFEPLKSLLEYTSIILIHHSNKSGYTKEIPTPEELLGSIDFTAEIDILFTLRKKDNETVGVYNLKARDSEIINPFKLNFIDHRNGLVSLQYEGEVEIDQSALKKRETLIIDFLKSGKKKRIEIIDYLEKLGEKEGTVNNTLTELRNKNLIDSQLVGKEAYYCLLEIHRNSPEERFPNPASIGGENQGMVVNNIDTTSKNDSQGNNETLF